MLGAHPSAHDDARGAYVDFVFSRSALLGPPPADAGSAARRLVGRKQNRLIAAADRNFARLAGLLSRRAAHAFWLPVPTWPGSVRSGKSGEVPVARRLVDLRSGSR